MQKLTALSLALILSFAAASASAKDYGMVFWYPGEAGSTAEAAPILTAFFDYINGRLGGDKVSGKYFNSNAAGIGYIKAGRPAFGIASWIALQENRQALPPYTAAAKTLPLPHGTTSDRFAVAGHSKLAAGNWTPPTGIIIYSSIPISKGLLKANLIPELKDDAKITETNAIFSTLKKIAAGGGANEVALLTPMERHAFDNMKGDWKNNLKILYDCKPIPTAELVYFGEKPPVTEQLLAILKGMPNDPEGREILETLRLKGFQ